MATEQLLYTSRAAHLISPAELQAIVTSSQRRNEPRGITGLLLYSGGYFMQMLEGEAGALDETYARIRRDPRHRFAQTLLRERCEKRLFPRWDMGLLNLDVESALDVTRLKDVMTSAAGGAAALAALREFRQQLPAA